MTNSGYRRLSLLGLSAVLTVLNSIKPVHIDDAANFYYARQIAEHPLDPFGFSLDWYDEPNTANEVLTPPVLPAWWALGIRVFQAIGHVCGVSDLANERVLWKLWLFPFVWLFVTAVYDLFRRFAPGCQMAMTWMVVLSPAFLPSLNLMLDIPALALALTSLRMFIAALERSSLLLAVAAGLVAGLAMQTKYTGFLMPAVMLLYALLREQHVGQTWLASVLRQMRASGPLWFTAATVAVAVFLSWEAVTAVLYGQSHFLIALGSANENSKFMLIFPFVVVVGGIGGPILLLSAAALWWNWKLIATALGVVVLSYAGIVLLPAERQQDRPWPEAVVFFLLGGLVLASLTIAALRLCRPRRWGRRRCGRAGDFLLLWLLLEMAGYLALSPFPAVRRLLGFEIVALLLLARLAILWGRRLGHRPRLGGVAVLTALLGSLFWCVDLREARAEQEGAERAVHRVREEDNKATIWYLGHWGFQYHMDRLGARAVIPPYPPRSTYVPLPEPTVFHKDDWLVWPEKWVNQQAVELDLDRLQEIDTIEVDDCIPWRTVIYFYGSGTGVPIRHHHGPRLRIKIYRVLQDFPAGASE